MSASSTKQVKQCRNCPDMRAREAEARQQFDVLQSELKRLESQKKYLENRVKEYLGKSPRTSDTRPHNEMSSKRAVYRKVHRGKVDLCDSAIDASVSTKPEPPEIKYLRLESSDEEDDD